MAPMSLRPSTFTEGGLLDDVDVRVTAASFLLYDYGGKSTRGVSPALGLTITHQEGDETKENDQYFSAGDAAYFYPSKDNASKSSDNMGDYLIPIGDKQGLNGNTNLAKFLTSLVNAGYPEDKLDNFKASDLVGLEFHLKREAVKRTGLIRTGPNANREQTVITVSKIIKLPWETGTAKPAATTKAATNGKANGAAAAPAAGDGALVEKCNETLMMVLMEAGGGPLPKTKAATLAFNALKGDPMQKIVSQSLYKDDILHQLPGIAFDGAAVRLSE